MQYYYNTKSRCDRKKRISDSYSTPKYTVLYTYLKTDKNHFWGWLFGKVLPNKVIDVT